MQSILIINMAMFLINNNIYSELYCVGTLCLAKILARRSVLIPMIGRSWWCFLQGEFHVLKCSKGKIEKHDHTKVILNSNPVTLRSLVEMQQWIPIVLLYANILTISLVYRHRPRNATTCKIKLKHNPTVFSIPSKTSSTCIFTL